MENNKNLISIDEFSKAKISLASFDDEIKVILKPSSNSIIDFLDLKTNQNIIIEANENSTCTIRFLIENDKKTLNLQAFLKQNSHLNIYFADYTHGDTNVNSNIAIEGKDAKTEVFFTALGQGEEKKKYDISFDHKAKNTYSNFECFGVAMHSSFLKINGVTHIEKDMSKCEAHQKAKIILFDETSRAIANPILKIDCEDIIASHACAIGSLNGSHIFYLLSRGLSLKEARKLITTGYLLPIKDKFDDEEKNKIISYVEGDFE